MFHQIFGIFRIVITQQTLNHQQPTQRVQSKAQLIFVIFSCRFFSLAFFSLYFFFSFFCFLGFGFSFRFCPIRIRSCFVVNVIDCVPKIAVVRIISRNTNLTKNYSLNSQIKWNIATFLGNRIPKMHSERVKAKNVFSNAVLRLHQSNFREHFQSDPTHTNGISGPM